VERLYWIAYTSKQSNISKHSKQGKHNNMSLLSINLTKKKRLSLQGVELRAPKPRIQAPPTLVDLRAPTEEEIAYSKLVAKYPLLEKLVNRVGLVSDKTRERLRIIKHPEERKLFYSDKEQKFTIVNT
jgi:hypothetical protein